MKKLLSFFIALTFIILSVFCVPFSANATESASGSKQKTYITKDNPAYKVQNTVYAESYMLINLDDDSYPVIASKNATKRRYPASLTKIVTTMVTLNNVQDLQSKVTVSESAVNSLIGTGAQIAGLKAGNVLTVEQLLYLTMVYSACDACEVLAEYVGGSVDNFVKMMNDYAKSCGAKSTNFVNPDGLHNENHYTTALDMANITLNAIQNDTFNKISSTKTYKYNDTTFVHTNYMLDSAHLSYYYEYAEGIKTGSTDEAGYCVITKASKDGYNYLAVVMGSPIKTIDGYATKCSFIDAASLFDWAFDNLKYTTIVRKNDVVTELPVTAGKDADTVQLTVKDDVTSLVPTSLDPSAVIIEPIDPPKKLSAPITQYDYVCKAKVIYADKQIATINLVAAQTVEMSTFLKIAYALKTFFTNKIVIAVLAIIIVAVIIYIIILFKRLNADKKRVAQKRKQREIMNDKENDDYLPPPKR